MKDVHEEKMELRFLRDTDGREIDFVVLKSRKPLMAVECKSGDRPPSRWASYFRDRTTIPQFFQVHRGHSDFGNSKTDIRVLPFITLCKEILSFPEV